MVLIEHAEASGFLTNNLALRWGLHLVEDPKQCGLAGAVGTDDPVAVSLVELKADLVKQGLTAKVLADVGGCNHGDAVTEQGRPGEEW